MFALIGFVVVGGAIVAGYMMENGKLLVLLQPAELVIILGAALGTILIANPTAALKRMFLAISRSSAGIAATRPSTWKT